MIRSAVGDWRSIGDLGDLVDEPSVRALLRGAGMSLARARPYVMRIKPAAAIVGYRLRPQGSMDPADDVFGYARTGRSGEVTELARRWGAKRTTETRFGPGVRLLPGGRTLLFVFPNDHRLRGLEALAEPKRFLRALGGHRKFGHSDGLADGTWRVQARSTVEPVSYHPEHRAVFAAQVSLREREDPNHKERVNVFVRVYRGRDGKRLKENFRSLRTAGFDAIPRLIGTLRKGQLLIERRVEGEQLYEALVRGDDPQPLSDALVRLHRTSADIGRTFPPGALFDLTSTQLSVLSRLRPELGAEATALLKRLRSRIPSDVALVPIHGDLHARNVMIGPAGIVFLDLDESRMGHPLHDVGDFVARTWRAADNDPGLGPRAATYIDRFVESYLRTAGISVSRDLDFFLACGALRRALGPILRFEPDGDARSRSSVELAATVLRDRPFDG